MSWSAQQIAAETAEQAGYRLVDLIEPVRGRELDAVRARAYWACRELRPDLSFPALGRALHRHHATILQGARAYAARRSVDPVERADGDRVISAFRADASRPMRLCETDRRLLEAAMAGQTLPAVAAHAGIERGDAVFRLSRIAAICGALVRAGLA